MFSTLFTPITAALVAVLSSSPAAASSSTGPTALVVAGVGLPNLLHAHAELFVAPAWSLELGGGIGVLPVMLTVGGRWSPSGSCWGCWDGHGLRLSPGFTWFIAPTDIEEGLVTLNGDLAWVWRGSSGWGMTAGVRLGAGIAYGQVAGGTKLEPGIEVVPLQVGLVR